MEGILAEMHFLLPALHTSEECLRLLQCGSKVGMHKVVALVEHRLSFVAGQSVGEAVAEVQVRGVAAAFAVVAVGLARNPRLRNGYRLDDDLRLED